MCAATMASVRLVGFMRMDQWYEAWDLVEELCGADPSIAGSACARALVVHVACKVVEHIGEDWQAEIAERVGKVLGPWATPDEFLAVHVVSCREYYDFKSRYAVLAHLPRDRLGSAEGRCAFLKEAMNTFHDYVETDEGPPDAEDRRRQLAGFYRFCYKIDRETTTERAGHFVECAAKDYRKQWREFINTVLTKRVRESD